jgi:fumarate hydratase class II
MNQSDTRIEKDSMGEVKVPTTALWGAQTQRAVENFNISPLRIPEEFLKALALVKKAAAEANCKLDKIDKNISELIINAADEIIKGKHNNNFPIDVYQTGSGTSWNMNINEVISNIAAISAGNECGSRNPVHPNDHVNKGQSSNDVIPTAINVSASVSTQNLIASLKTLQNSLEKKAEEHKSTVKLGRTHLQDAVPMTVGQEFSGWATQIYNCISRIEAALPRLNELALGGTALGTGLNTHPEFAKECAEIISRETGISFSPAPNFFEAISARDSNLELMGALNVLASALMKIGNDLRILSSGPRAGFSEIELPSLQPGSSIMPGKVNPVIPESVIQAAATVMGKHTTVTIAAQNSPLQLNIMQPLIAYEILFSINLLSEASVMLATKCIDGIKVNVEECRDYIDWSLALVTPLAIKVGYDRAAEIAYKAYSEKIKVKDAALKLTDLSEEEINEIFNIEKMLGPK